MKNLLVLGATSAIAQAYVNRVADQCEKVMLVARDGEKLGHITSHVSAISDAMVTPVESDLADVSEHEKLLASAVDTLGSIDCVLIAYGQLTDQKRCIDEPQYALEQFNLNGTSTISLSLYLAGHLAQQGSGTLAVIGSVAGDRGRKSNYCYGAAKGAVDSFLSGLRAELLSSNVNVLNIKPGFVDTPMTSEFKKGFLWRSADFVAGDIDKAVVKGKSVVYTPWFWRFIMLIIKCIPEVIFKRLPL